MYRFSYRFDSGQASDQRVSIQDRQHLVDFGLVDFQVDFGQTTFDDADTTILLRYRHVTCTTARYWRVIVRHRVCNEVDFAQVDFGQTTFDKVETTT